MSFRPTVSLHRKISSFGFSGAGFLACYHLGVAQCLIDQSILTTLSSSRQDAIRLTGVSAGALIAASVLMGVSPEKDGMPIILDIAKQARAAGPFDALQPRFSLIDVVAKLFEEQLLRYSEQEFLLRINERKLLRIGLTDRRVFPPVGQNPRAFCFVEEFNSLEEVISSCVLSSYIPGITGPVYGSLDPKYEALKRASKVFENMIERGAVRQGLTGEPVRISSTTSRRRQRELAWDGGLVNAFPFIDGNTVIVCPLETTFTNHDSINPSIGSSLPQRYYKVNNNVKVHLTSTNLYNFRCITVSSEDHVLQAKFAQGYDNTKIFLGKRNLLSVFHSSVVG